FAQATFTQNGLGGNDALLVVAVDDHRYAWWEADNGPLRGIRDEVDGILSSSLDSRFRAGDYAGGVNDFARALRERLGGAAPPAAVTPAPGGTQQPAPAGGTSILGVIVAVILVLAGLLIIAGWWGRRRADRRTAEERDRRTGQLARDANALLIQTDDAVREAQQDADFVAAQFGDSEAAPYRDALATATAELKAAFGVRQKLDDSIPEDPETRERMLNEILTRARHAAALLDEQRRRAAELRESESKAPDVLAALPTAIDALAARLPTSQAAFARLGAYAPAAWAAVSGNGSEAEKRIASARADTERGTSLLATDRHAAAASTRSAQAAVAQANGLLDAIEKTAASLDETRRRLSAEIEAAAPDVERAKAAVAAGRVDPKAVSTVDEAQKLLAAARAEASADRPDVIAGYRQAQQANQLADSVLEGVRQAEERRAREAAALATAIHSAEVSIARASDYITARRNGVGREARTRLAEGQRHHDLALQLQNTDPARAVEEARLA
ncbi:MAG TPA: TPM domain-containing protein, partial [Candidatus Limnocylindrales bacterium]